MDDTNAPVTRGALERVLARAAELQAAGGDALDREAFTEEQLVELGREVGLAPEHLRQALAEERVRGEPTAPSAGLADYFFGTAQVTAQRVVRGTPAALMTSLAWWMQNEEWLRVVRQRPDRMVWEPRRDLLGGLRRIFGGRSHELHAASEIAGTVVAVDAERSVVALAADLGGARRSAVGQTVTATVFGAAVSGVLSILGFVPVVALAPVVVAGAASYAGARRANARARQRTGAALERVLDRLEQRRDEPAPPSPPSLLRAIESALPRRL